MEKIFDVVGVGCPAQIVVFRVRFVLDIIEQRERRGDSPRRFLTVEVERKTDPAIVIIEKRDRGPSRGSVDEPHRSFERALIDVPRGERVAIAHPLEIELAPSRDPLPIIGTR